MAEVIGVIASVAGLAGTAATVSLTLYDCGTIVAHAKKEMDSLAGDARDLSLTLEYLGEVLDRHASYVTTNAWKAVDNLVDKCKSALLEIRLATELVKTKSTRLLWLFRRPKIQQHKFYLDGFKSTLMLIIQTISLAKLLENDSKTPAAGDRYISEATQRSMDLLRCAIVTNRTVFEQITVTEKTESSRTASTKTDSDKKEKTAQPTVSQEGNSESPRSAPTSQGISTWDAVLETSYGDLNQAAIAPVTLLQYIPESIRLARSASIKNSTTADKPSSNDSSTSEKETDNEIRILLTEWTNASRSNVDTQLENSRQQKRTALPGVPQWIQDRYYFIGTDPNNPQHWTPKSTETPQETSLLPHSRFAYEPVEDEQTRLFDLLAEEGGAWVWRHDDGHKRDYFVKDKKIVQYFIKRPFDGDYHTTEPLTRTIVGKQWISKQVLEDAAFSFKEYGEGSWAIDQKLDAKRVGELHRASSARQENLLHRLGAKHSQPSQTTLSKKECIAVALFSFDGANPQDLPFRKGDKLTILGEVSNKSQWLTAMLNGKKGMIPSSYVRIM